MARDRKRAKQRQARRARDGARIAPSGVPLRGDVPAALDHASGDVDEFDAALIRGAQGVPAADEPEVATNGSEPPEDGAEAREEDGPDADAEGSTTTAVAPPEPSDAGESEPAGDWESEPPGEPDGQELPERAAEPSHASPAEALEDEPEQEDQSEEEDEEKRGAAVRRARLPQPSAAGGSTVPSRSCGLAGRSSIASSGPIAARSRRRRPSFWASWRLPGSTSGLRISWPSRSWKRSSRTQPHGRACSIQGGRRSATASIPHSPRS